MQPTSSLNPNDGQSAAKSTAEVDPLALLTEQLNQMDTKQADQDLKLTQLDAKLTVSATIAYLLMHRPRCPNMVASAATRGHGSSDEW